MQAEYKKYTAKTKKNQNVIILLIRNGTAGEYTLVFFGKKEYNSIGKKRTIMNGRNGNSIGRRAGMKAMIRETAEDFVEISWEQVPGAKEYAVLWADRDHPSMAYKEIGRTKALSWRLKKATHVPHYFCVEAWDGETKVDKSPVIRSRVRKVFHPQREKLNRGLAAVKTAEGVFVSWRLFRDETDGYGDTGMTGADFNVYRDGKKIAFVQDSTNYLDREGAMESAYQVSPVRHGKEGEKSAAAKPWISGENYLDIPLKRPDGGVTRPGAMHPEGETYTYSANDMSIGDVDGDGEYEYFVKWDPSNSHDVSHRGYTGNCIIDCYKLDGRLLWRLDMGKNIRAGAHYTQFMVYDFDGDGKAEMCVKTAPGTKMTVYGEDGAVRSERYITLPPEDVKAGYANTDDYVCSAQDYRRHMAETFLRWHEHPEVKSGRWPGTLEECFGVPVRYAYPLSMADAEALADYFIRVYAPSRSEKNHLEAFEGFIYEGPEYLTMFSGDGRELETIAFPVPRQDDGLLWGDYSMRRIEPCNRVDRFLSAVAYLDGERPSVIIGRGYYTRTTVTAYDFRDGHFIHRFTADSGHVPMRNPFRDDPHAGQGDSPTHGAFAGQGNHSMAIADVDGDGRQEIVYGAAVIDQDGSLLYSSYGPMPDGSMAKFGHGDSMHCGVIDPDRPGMQIFNVFEGAKAAPWGFALRDAETGEVIFGQRADTDLGRCMVGDVVPGVRGLQCWVNEMYDCRGNRLNAPVLGTNASIRWAADLSTQITDGANYLTQEQTGVIMDNTHGVMLRPQDTKTNNGTKGNPCLIADLFGDFREEILLRKADSSAIRIYMNTEITRHKLFTLLHDIQYRVGIAWQNNCYNQPCYPSFYYAGDMDWADVMPELRDR